MKRVAANSKKSHFVWEEASAKFKQQRLLEDYLEVQKLSLLVSMDLNGALYEVQSFTVVVFPMLSKPNHRGIAKQKREILLAEVRFLRRRHKHLKMQSEELEVKQGLVANSSTQSRMLANNENHGVNEVSVNNLPPVLVAHPILGGEGWNRERKEEVVLESTRVKKKRKTHTINEKRVGKKKISWQDQVALKA
ncbi:hypothetical protein KPL70_000128 [Citrus sinensis]|uniref:Uncharacterized protein n=1 Tax=Citrus sinensis TaxID=2711 RepID=A0ACB8NLI8_CITSI|nr:hypothetical protein KPL70_000128 [Citrus sinensis]KAH9798757.1 hypothetical protein KPL71_000134 [Citrus sinensis]